MSPGTRTLGTGDELAPAQRGSSRRPLEAFLEDVEAGVEHVPRYVQRRDVSHRRVATRKQNQGVLVRVLLDRFPAFRIGFLGSFVCVDLGGLHLLEAA